METKRFGIGAAIGWGFRTFIEHILFFVAVAFIAGPIMLAVLFVIFYSCGYFTHLSQEVVLVNSIALEVVSVNSTIAFFCSFLLVLGLSFLGAFFDLGFTKIQLELHDTGKSSMRTLFSQGNLLLRGWAANFLFVFLVALGTVCFIIPGIYFFCRFYFYQYALVDKKLGVIESFREAERLSKDARWALFGLSIINSVLNVLPFTVFITSLAQAYAYREQGELAKGVVSLPFES